MSLQHDSDSDYPTAFVAAPDEQPVLDPPKSSMLDRVKRRAAADLRSAMGEVATRDFLRGELRDLLQEINDRLTRIEESTDPLDHAGAEERDPR